MIAAAAAAAAAAAVQCAGFLPRDPEYASLLENAKVDVPTLFVMGQSDALIPPARSHALMDTFDQRTADMFEHPGGAGCRLAYFIPACTCVSVVCMPATGASAQIRRFSWTRAQHCFKWQY
jgi:dienelactone hydrolase